MDKEIIIDGVNVAGCVQLVEEPFYPCGLGGECKGWENCYYKQLKRLEQENAELKAYKDVNEDFKTAWEELKAENEKLTSWLASSEKEKKKLCNVIHKKKEQIQTMKYMLFDEKEIPKDKFTMYYRIAQNERRTKSHRDLCTNVVKKYRQTLQEIKAIVCGNYEIIDPQGRKDILKLITKAEEE